MRRSRALGLLVVAAAALPGCARRPEGNATGLVAWESNRSGAFRIWLAPLPTAAIAAAPRQLSPDEPGRNHCCPALSPDGRRLIYLSLPERLPKREPRKTPGELRLVELESGRSRTLSTTAQQTGEYRAVLWWSATDLVYLEGDDTTRRLDLETGSNRVIVPASEGGGWLVAKGGRYATRGAATFSTRDAATGAIRLAPDLGGCQPTFSADGAYGIWTAGAGGPLDRVDLVSRETRSIVRGGDERLPDGRRYLYFPAISADRTIFAWAASDGAHDHNRADYDVYVAELDARTLELAGAPRAVAPHPGVDRYPDVYRAATNTPERSAEAFSSRSKASDTAPLFVWRSANDDNRRRPDADPEALTASGVVRFDPRGRLELAGGFAAASPASASRVDLGLRETNALTVALVVEPASLAADATGPLVALERGPKRRGFSLRQRGPAVELFLLTGATLPVGAVVASAPLPDGAPHAVAFRFSPSRLAVFVDGAAVERKLVTGDFFRWRDNDSLRLGADRSSDERFRGWLSDVAIWPRELDDAELAAHAAQALGRLRGARPD